MCMHLSIMEHVYCNIYLYHGARVLRQRSETRTKTQEESESCCSDSCAAGAADPEADLVRFRLLFFLGGDASGFFGISAKKLKHKRGWGSPSDRNFKLERIGASQTFENNQLL